MWNQWSSVPILTAPLPPLPTSAVQTQPPLPSAPPPPPPAVSSQSEQTSVNSVPFIGPTMPGMPPITASAGSAMTPVPTVDQTNPYSQYTAAQYATMTPDQQYAFQQHWQQWQAYQQEYAKWHAQYGEQYKREIAAAAVATGVSGATSYAGYFPQQPAVQPFQQPPPLPLSKPKEETVQTQNKISCKISGEPQMYNKPPPPLPQATSHNTTQQSQWIQPFSHINVNFSQPPPQLNVRSNFSTSQIDEINVQKPPPQVQSNRNQMITNPATNPSPSVVTEIPQLGNSKPSISDNYIIDKKINAAAENSENNYNDKTETYNYVEQERECNDETNNQSGIESVFKNSKSMWDHNMSRSREDQNTINITRSDLAKTNNRCNWQKNDFSAGNFAVEQRKSSFNNECWESNSTLINRKSYNNMNRNNSWVQGSSNTFTTIDRTPQPCNSNYKQNQQRKVPDLDEESFDRQFRQWEEEFEKWKTANANNPDREMYLQYEREFEKQRQRIIERRNNMRKRKMEQNNLNEKDQNQIPNACNESSYEYGFENKIKSNSSEVSKEFLVAEDTGKMQNTNVLEKVSAADMQTVDENTSKQFVGKKEEESYDTRKIILGKRKTRFSDASNDVHKNEITVSEVINLAEDSDDERKNVISKENTNKKINEIFDKNSGIPGLDLIGEVEPFKQIDKVSEEKQQRQEAKQDFCEPTSAKTKKIPSLFDIVVEDPNKSPNPSGVVEGSQSGNIPPTVHNRSMLSNVSIVTNSLQDPNVLHNITKALAYVQGLPNLPTQEINLVNAPEIIEKLPALLQIVQQQHQQKFSENRSFDTGNFIPDVLGMGGQSNCHNEQNFNKNQHLNDGGGRGNSFGDKIENYCRNDSNDNRFGSSFSNASWINSYNDTDQGGNNYDGTMIRGDGNFKGNDRHFQNRHRFQEGKIRNHTRTDIKRNFGGSIRGRKGNDNKRGRINRDNEDRNPINNMEDNTKDIDCVKNNSTGSKKSKIQNPFRRDAVAMPIFNDEINKAVVTKKEGNSSWNNNSGQDEYFVSNMRVFEYKVNGTVPPKIFDYGHKPVLKSDDYKPVKTIDYGHASKVKTNYSPNNESRQNEFGRVPNNDDNRDISEDALDKETSNNQSVQISGGLDKSNVKNSSLITNPNAADDIYKYNTEGTKKLITSEDLEEISDIEEGTTQRERSESPPPPPPLMYSSSKPASVFPSTAEANKEILKISSKRIGMSVPKIHNHNTVAVDEIILNPGRSTRPAKVCILIRGPPGSGKSHVAKLLKEKEILMGNSHVRILSIDDYFIVENDYEEICSKSGKKVPKKELLYEYDKDMEETYLQYLIKAFKKTINDNFYDFIIIDCNNNTMRSLNEFYFYAKDSGYMPYIVDLKCDVELCLNRNIHERSKQDIEEILKSWDTTPTNYIKLDVNTILENTVEMEDTNDMVVENIIESGSSEDTLGINEKTLEKNYESNDDSNDTRDLAKTCGFLKSKWENDTTSENLARLDGITKSISKRKAASMEDYLQLDECHTAVSDGKKRVRWADIEESRKQDQMRAIGFVVGQTDWQRMMDPNAAKRALNKTKYIERVQKRNS